MSRIAHSVIIVTGYGLGDRGSIPDRGGRFFFCPLRPAGSGAHQISSKMGTGDLPGGKYSWGILLTINPLLVPWVKKEWSYTSSPAMRQNWHGTSNFNFFYLKFANNK
jgi:hypothetical protein